ncbi:exosortase F system-associated membrane protein [Flavobacterium chilense]|uniref:Exosortase F-associated protein n=1 Tax=Flavobacterium chilense TaxID=946677 RepID=A0A1M7KLQ2_9FLAO|nr:exosortase F system-associated protein [Flavobacterium chilense]SHM66384.1 exosortase F-associated protein [Flavobacterium chilense]
MLNRILEHKFKILVAILIVLCFAIIRTFENKLFYDPFLVYFELDFKNLPLPQTDGLKLFCSLLLRFILNSVLSLILIYTLFRDRDMLKFSVFLYGVFAVILFAVFFIILESFSEWNWLLFYVRRFIIQPLFVILFIPAFYYQQQNLKK